MSKEYASIVLCGEIMAQSVIMFPWKFCLQEPSQNRSKSGLSGGMSERSSRGFEIILIVVRQLRGTVGLSIIRGGVR